MEYRLLKLYFQLGASRIPDPAGFFQLGVFEVNYRIVGSSQPRIPGSRRSRVCFYTVQKRLVQLLSFGARALRLSRASLRVNSTASPPRVNEHT